MRETEESLYCIFIQIPRPEISQSHGAPVSPASGLNKVGGKVRGLKQILHLSGRNIFLMRGDEEAGTEASV